MTASATPSLIGFVYIDSFHQQYQSKTAFSSCCLILVSAAGQAWADQALAERGNVSGVHLASGAALG